MKKTLLLFFFAFLTVVAFAQRPGIGGDECGPGVSGQANASHSNVYSNNAALAANTQPSTAAYLLYPNPTTGYFAIDEESLAEGKVRSINVFNMVGQRIRSFRVEKGQRYDIADLREGLYLIQLLDHENKPLATRRLHKMPGIRP